MGHDHHFLSRLDRVSTAHTELALALYRDHELLKTILWYIKPETDAERIAISLRDPKRGPFIIVTRTGRFVTCLGEGMVVRDLPIIERERFDAMTEHVHDIRRRIEAALRGNEDRIFEMVQRLVFGGSRVHREDIATLWALRGIMVWKMALKWPSLFGESMQIIQRLLHVETVRAKDQAELRRLWGCQWYASHITALSGLDQPVGVPDAFVDDHGMRKTLVLGAILAPPVYSQVRGMWLAGTMGEKALEIGEQQWHSRVDSATLHLLAMQIIVAAAWRKPALLADARAILSRPPESDDDPILRDHWDYVQKNLATVMDPERGYESGAAYLREVAFRVLQRCPRKHDMHYERPEEVPLDVAVPLFAQHPAGAGKLEVFFRVLGTMAVIAPLQTEDLYLPRELNEAIGRRWSDNEGQLLFDAVRRIYIKQKPKRAEPKPGANAPCTCGSGRKYKRCCGDASKPREPPPRPIRLPAERKPLIRFPVPKRLAAG